MDRKNKRGKFRTSHRKKGDGEIVNESLGSKRKRRRRRWRCSGCGYSKHSVHSERVTYWTECLPLCLSVSLKQLCSMLKGTLHCRDSGLSLRFSCLVTLFPPLPTLHLCCCHSLFFSFSFSDHLELLPIILSLSWSPSHPDPNIRPSNHLVLSPSLPLPALFPCFSLSLSLSLSFTHSHSLSVRREGKQHQRPSHSASTCNRVQTAPSASPPLLFDSRHPSQKKATVKKGRSQECSRAGEDLFSLPFDQEFRRGKSEKNRG